MKAIKKRLFAHWRERVLLSILGLSTAIVCISPAFLDRRAMRNSIGSMFPIIKNKLIPLHEATAMIRAQWEEEGHNRAGTYPKVEGG